MTTQSTDAERRQFDRYPLVSQAFAVFKSEQPKLAQLIDISEGGLGVWYVDGDTIPEPSINSIDIFAVNSPVRITALPVEMASDFVLETDADAPDEPVRRRGFRFGRLMHTQRNALSDFIKDNAGTTL